jgi:hypothetical protein
MQEVWAVENTGRHIGDRVLDQVPVQAPLVMPPILVAAPAPALARAAPQRVPDLEDDGNHDEQKTNFQMITDANDETAAYYIEYADMHFSNNFFVSY